MIALPPRYEALRRLGRGGGGEVWSVRDRVTSAVCALKVLAENAGADEAAALVREAVALSGLEGLGLPRVLAFGALPGSGRRYMVRELVSGESLDDVLDDDLAAPWLEPLARASEQLTVLHRAGLLHGDVKPGNVIVGEAGAGTLVDLGLAAPWREGGIAPRGLTPRFAAPELFEGEPLTVRAEVFALGATLADALARRGGDFPLEVRIALTKIAARATEASPSARYPSVDELATALRNATGLPPAVNPGEAAWPVLGIDGSAQRLAAEVAALGPGQVLAMVGPSGSGRSTLLRRLSWSLGVEGQSIVALERPTSGVSAAQAAALELGPLLARDAGDRAAANGHAPIVVVDDFDLLDGAMDDVLKQAAARGARLVVVTSEPGSARARALAADASGPRPTAVFEVPPLDRRSSEELVARAAPSLPLALRAHLVERVLGRPGRLRSLLRLLRGRVLVAAADIDALLFEGETDSLRPPSNSTASSREETLALAERALDMGRFDEVTAYAAAVQVGAPKTRDEEVRLSIVQGRLSLGRGDTAGAARLLDATAQGAAASLYHRAWQASRARTWLREGRPQEAAALAGEVVLGAADDALTADALAIRGVALAYTGADAEALALLDRGVTLARSLGERRVEAVALGSLAIVHQRAGRAASALRAYEESLAAAEAARDAGTVAATRLNLAGLAHAEGDIAGALNHLEAAVDLGQRAGGLVAVEQARLNLAGLDLYLGRYARASAAITALASRRDDLPAMGRAQLLGLEAELSSRTGDVARGASLYDACAEAWSAQGRTLDAAEARLEGFLVRAQGEAGSADASELSRQFDALGARLGEGGYREHEALAGIVRAAIEGLLGHDAAARTALDRALAQAEQAGRREWAWRALDARARLSTVQGSVSLAKRDTEAALVILEETAAKLPRDLREVFWDDPRRRALRHAHAVPAARLPVDVPRGTRRSVTFGRGSGTTTLGAPLPPEDRLARIFEITRELATEQDLERLLNRVTDHAVALLGAERGYVLLVGESGELETRAARSRKADDPHVTFSRSVAEEVLRTGQPVIAESARDDARLKEAVSVHQLMIQSIACVPIVGAPPLGRAIGALYVETRLRPGRRFHDELPTLSAFADQAAISIENARLLTENRARADELSRANLELEAARDKLAGHLGRRTEQLAATRRDLREARAQLRSHFGYAGLVGTSGPMRRVYAIIERIKDTDVPVLIRGESGTGKEMVAQAIHGRSDRGKRPFLGVNCGAIPAALLESELFGHVRGAFTGADRDRRGLFREAEGGTLLLDEIGEMPLKMQTGLLRVLQEKKVRPVGGAAEADVDVRVLAATNRDLQAMVQAGTFREDLYYRLHVVELVVPALRERPEDIPPLIDHFLTLFAARYRRDRKTVTRDAIRSLSSYEWPGNVRQLEHVLLNAWLMSEGTEIGLDDLPLEGARASAERAAASAASGSPRGRPSSVEAAPPDSPPPPGAAKGRGARALSTKPTSREEFKETERARILNALTASNWNRVQAAKMVGLPRRTFYRRLKEYEIG